MVTPSENTEFNHSMGLPKPRAANSGTFHERYHHTPTISSRRSSPCPSQYAPYPYNQPVYPRPESGRAAFKRKSTSLYPAYHNDHGYCSAGSSTTLPDPRNNFQLKPVPEFFWTQPSSSTTTSYPSNNLLHAGDERNVRSRHGDAYHNPAWQSSSSNLPHQLYPSVNNLFPNGVGQWGNHPLPGTHSQWIHPTGAGSSSYTMNQSVGGNTNNHGGFQYSPTSHYSISRGIGAGPSSYNHRQIPHRVSSGDSNLAFKDTVTDALHGNLRPLARNGSLRISNDDQPLFHDENARIRWTSRVPDLPYFDSLDLIDEHRNLRLDVDAMSYEELLALEERIGNVNTGLSEDDLPSCLTLSVYRSSTLEDVHEASCPICLEEYKDNDNLGTMKCLHLYHVSCIKDWLRMKNACPICKSPALDDTLKKS